MSITVHMPNEKVAKAFLAAKPDNVSAKGVTVKVADKEISAYDQLNVTTAKKGKRLGVMSVTKAENAQLGLLLKYIFTNDEVYNSLPADVLRYPEALNKLAGRYS
jgi:hypothetical protein